MKFIRNWRQTPSAAGFRIALIAAVCATAALARSAERDRTEVGKTASTSSISLPVGTILPVRLQKTISVDDAQAGQAIEAEIMQEVPLADREKIRMKSRVTGTIVSAGKASAGGVQMSMRFDAIEYRNETIPMATSLRAMASYQAVQSAQAPINGGEPGTPSGWANTMQIGGDIRYGDGGEVRDQQKQSVGKGVNGGVLVHVRAVPGSPCEGPVNGDDSLQALWVFSSDACGVYEMRGVQITHTGKTDPVGVITLTFEKAGAKLDGFTGMLLRVVAAP